MAANVLKKVKPNIKMSRPSKASHGIATACVQSARRSGRRHTRCSQLPLKHLTLVEREIENGRYILREDDMAPVVVDNVWQLSRKVPLLHKSVWEPYGNSVYTYNADSDHHAEYGDTDCE